MQWKNMYLKWLIDNEICWVLMQRYTIPYNFKMNFLGMVSKFRVRYYLATSLIAMFITLSLCPFSKKVAGQ